MDAVDPALVERAEHALEHTDGVHGVHDLRLRWIGHRLTGSATVEMMTTDLQDATHVADHAAERVRQTVGNLDTFSVTPNRQT
ncbi:cation transporter dimerization domain-containing protein [Curtobacterium sp. 24E2]|nr:hypothetical protein JN350_12110 [Curtobacterium sp. 24E2]